MLFGELISWCLMPNHFHWQFYVKYVELERRQFWEHVDQVEFQRRRKKYGKKALPVERAWSRSGDKNKKIALGDAIGFLEQAYSKAINRERGWSGSLFRKQCKAKDGWIDEFITLKKPDGKLDYRFLEGTDYAYPCFCYIHENPKNAGLVNDPLDWPYSSARDYAGLRNGTLCNVALGKKLLGLER